MICMNSLCTGTGKCNMHNTASVLLLVGLLHCSGKTSSAYDGVIVILFYFILFYFILFYFILLSTIIYVM